jgi:formylglycine-generating enzyme required for sulfatase activity
MTRFIGVFLLMLFTSSYPIAICSAQGGTAKQGTRSAYKAATAKETIRIGQIVRDCTDCPDMVVVPEVGHTASDPGKVFYAGRFEITWRQYLVAVRDGTCPVPLQGYNKPHDVHSQKINDDYPLTAISPDVFSCYLEWIQQKTKRIYRIPSASEWEHIARAGTATEYYWVNGLGHDNAVVFDYFNAKELQRRLRDTLTSFRDDPRGDVKWKDVYPVGQFKPNPWGLHDVIGNAAEVTTESYPPLPACLKNQPATVCEAVSVRGNDRVRSPNPMTPNPPITESLTTTRFRAPAHGGTSRTGFRVVRD